MKNSTDIEKIFKEYENGKNFKSGLYNGKGMYEQNKKNERFYTGDQWFGARCGNDRPLVRYNVIKRIGDYKIAMVSANPVGVSFYADGIPNTLDIKSRADKEVKALGINKFLGKQKIMSIPSNEEISVVMDALSNYYEVTAERLKFNQLASAALKNAYISGDGIIYTYWDSAVKTGLYADEGRTKHINGDIKCEVLDIENVYFGDPNNCDVQSQPYIIIAQRKSVAELKREAMINGISKEDIEEIKSDSDRGYMAGDRASLEPDESKKATVLTKFWKEWDEDTGETVLKAVKVTKGTVIKPEWDMKIRLYPLAKMAWENRKNCAYSESEISYLIPNQIAINRMITASVWAVMMMGMPIMVVNGDVVTDTVTNEPGQVLTCSGEDAIRNAVGYINPPQFSSSFDINISSLVNNTMSQAGANDAALGNIKPDNMSAIVAVREAAMMPMQVIKNNYYQFCEDIARIWAEYWITMYGRRSLKIEDETGCWYMPFDGERYKTLLISVKSDVGASTIWSEAQSIQTLDNLFDKGIIDVVQYLKRLPKGVISDVSGLIKEMQSVGFKREGNDLTIQPDPEKIISALSPETKKMFLQLDEREQERWIKRALGENKEENQ